MKFFILATALFLMCFATVDGQEQKVSHLKFSYPSLTKTRVPLWIAKDNRIFEKYGLDVGLIVIRSGNTAVSALINGEIDILGGPASTSMLAAESGLPVVIIGTFGPASRKLVVPDRIKTVQDLRGKTVGVSNFGTIIDFSVRRALARLGMTPGKDVNLLPTGLSQPVQRMLLMFQGKIDATLASDDEIYTIGAMGYKVRVLAALEDLGIHSSYSDLSVTREMLKTRRTEVKSFLMAFSEAVAVGKRNKEAALASFRRHMRVDDPKLLDIMYQTYVLDAAPVMPYPLENAINSDIEILSATRPGLKGKTAADFVDTTLLKELEAEGFFKKVAR
jgi:ABC-type nitrate/sulfonate/bicarbonate transport system substrate-binding protein